MRTSPENVCIGAFPEDHPERILHDKRYGLACEVAGGITIDAACGFGFGSEQLARKAAVTTVLGYDRDQTAIWHGQALYARPRKKDKAATPLTFHCEDLEDPVFPLCDTFVCIETLEHLERPETFVAAACRSAAERIVVSTPIVPTTATNPWHVQDFTVGQVNKLFADRGWYSGWTEFVKDIYLLAVYIPDPRR